MTGGIAKTFSTSLLIDRVAEKLGAPLFETPIGFKHVAELMNRGQVAAGGEESGGYAFAFHLPERDGVFNALLLLESLAQSGKDLDGALADLASEFGNFAYGRSDVYLPVPVVSTYLDSVRRDPPTRVAGIPVQSVRACRHRLPLRFPGPRKSAARLSLFRVATPASCSWPDGWGIAALHSSRLASASSMGAPNVSTSRV